MCAYTDVYTRLTVLILWNATSQLEAYLTYPKLTRIIYKPKLHCVYWLPELTRIISNIPKPIFTYHKLFLIPTKITPLQYTFTLENTQVFCSYLRTRTCIHMHLKNCHRERLRLRVFILHNTKLSFTLLCTQWCVDGYVTWLTTYVCASKKNHVSFARMYLYAYTYTHNLLYSKPRVLHPTSHR